MPRVYLYSLANKQQTAVTDSWYGSGEPVFSDDGKYLLLASARDFQPTFGDPEFAHVYRDMQRVYLVTLAKDTANPLAPKSDEVGKAAEKREKEKAKQAEEKKPEASPGEKKPEEKPKKPVVVKVDTDGIQNRIVGLEITPGNYRNIRMLDDGRIFYLRRTAADEVGEDDEEGFPDRDRKSHLCVYKVDDRKETVLGDANNYQITFDGNHRRARELRGRFHPHCRVDQAASSSRQDLRWHLQCQLQLPRQRRGARGDPHRLSLSRNPGGPDDGHRQCRPARRVRRARSRIARARRGRRSEPARRRHRTSGRLRRDVQGAGPQD